MNKTPSRAYSTPIRVYGSPRDALQKLHGPYQANDRQGAPDALRRFADLYHTRGSLNNLIKRIKRTAYGFRNFANYRIRALPHAGKPN